MKDKCLIEDNEIPEIIEKLVWKLNRGSIYPSNGTIHCLFYLMQELFGFPTKFEVNPGVNGIRLQDLNIYINFAQDKNMITKYQFRTYHDFALNEIPSSVVEVVKLFNDANELLSKPGVFHVANILAATYNLMDFHETKDCFKIKKDLFTWLPHYKRFSDMVCDIVALLLKYIKENRNGNNKG